MSLDSDDKTDAYLNMNEISSGLPIELSPEEEALQNCDFDTEETQSMRNLQVTLKVSQSENPTYGVFVYDYSSSPLKVLQSLNKWKEALTSE